MVIGCSQSDQINAISSRYSVIQNKKRDIPISSPKLTEGSLIFRANRMLYPLQSSSPVRCLLVVTKIPELVRNALSFGNLNISF